MIETAFNNLLLISLLLPLLFAIPVVRHSLPQRAYINPLSLALLPCLLLVIYPAAAEVNADWLFFGSGLALDNNNRWLLATSIITWLILSFQQTSTQSQTINNNGYALLTLAGSTGTILSADILTFFIFSSFMGYALFGVLYHQQNRQLKSAGTIYIVCLLIADIALFDALLIAVHTIENLQFDVIQIYMSDISTNQLYVLMTLSGFILRGAIWPTHIWLSRTFASINKQQAALLSAIPVAMALLGFIRWLPTEQGIDQNIAQALHIIAIASITYATVRLIAGSTGKQLSAWLTLIYTGLFLYSLGIFFKSETAWITYEFAVIPYIAIGSLIISITCWMQSDNNTHEPDMISRNLDRLQDNIHESTTQATHQLKQIIEALKTIWRMTRKTILRHMQKFVFAKHSSKSNTNWSVSITLLLILGIIIAAAG